MVFKIFSILFLFLMVSPSPAQLDQAKADCLRIALGITKRKFFNIYSYQGKKSSFLQSLSKGESIKEIDLAKNEDFLAYIEAVSQNNGLSRLRLEEILQGGDSKKRRKLLDSLEKLRKKRRKMSLKNFTQDFYSMVYAPEAKGLQRFYKIKDDIHVRVESEILQNNLETALDNLGFLKNNNMRARLRQWRDNHKNKERAAISLALNSISVNYLGFISYLPKTSFLRTKKIPPELIELIRREGFDAAYPKILKQFKSRAVADQFYRKAQKAYVYYINVILAQMLYEHYPEIKSMIGFEDFDLAPEDEKVKREQAKNWKAIFHEFEPKRPAN